MKAFMLLTLGSASAFAAPYSTQYQTSQDYNDYNQYPQGYTSQAPESQYYNQNQNQDSQFFYSQDQQQNQGQYSNQNSPTPANYSQAQRNGYAQSNGQTSDQEIAKQIHDEVSEGWISKGYPNISFGVHNGNVTLKGSVDSEDNKRKLEETVRDIDGVKQINNQVVVEKKQTAYNYNNKQNPYYAATTNTQNSFDNSSVYSTDANTQDQASQDFAATPADRELNRKIRDQLNGSFFSTGYDSLTLRTSNGAVTVMGTVESSDDVRKIQDKLRGISGVKSLNNQIVVKNQ